MSNKNSHGNIETGNQYRRRKQPTLHINRMEVHVGLQQDEEDVEDFPNAEPEEFAICGAQNEEQECAQACKQPNKGVDVLLTLGPEKLVCPMSLPLPDKSGI